MSAPAHVYLMVVSRLGRRFQGAGCDAKVETFPSFHFVSSGRWFCYAGVPKQMISPPVALTPAFALRGRFGYTQ